MMSKWDAKLDKAEKFLEASREHGRGVYRRFKDDRDDARTRVGKRVNLFYANVHTLKESLFNSMPKPDVSRVQRGDFEDDASRVAANIVQRALTYEIECAPDFMESVTSAIIDRLVPGTGQVWVTFGAQEDDNGAVAANSEQITIEHVYWEDFLYEPARKWSKVGWVARRLHLTRQEFKENYPDGAIDDAGAPGDSARDTLTKDEVNQSKLCVYEVWDRNTKKVYHIVKGRERPLKTLDDPYKLAKFFPCPRPLIANVDTTNFLPVTDFYIAQDQYIQLDVLYARIDLIVQAIKVAGLYDAANSSIGRMLTEGENMLIPVDNWAMHAEKGGNKGQIDWFPVEVVASVLQQLYGAFEATKAILFEITGMSDIIRGQSNPYETKGAQEIKAQFASIRMNGYQRDVAVFVRDTMRIMAEMFTQLYSDEKILTIIGKLSPADEQYLPQAAEILRSDVLSRYKVNISAGSLTQADWAMEKEQRMELVSTLGQMVGQISTLAQQVPGLEMLGAQLIKFAVAGYKGGSELEGYIDQALDELQRASLEAKQNPQPPQPDPAQIKAESDAKLAEAELQRMQMDAELRSGEFQAKAALEQRKAEMDMQLKQIELQYREREAQLSLEIKMVELQLKQETARLGLETQQAKGALSLEQQAASAAIKGDKE